MTLLPKPGRRLIRDSAWVFLGQIGVAIAGLAGFRVLTELAAKDVAGEAALLLSTLVLGRNVFIALFSNTQLRHYPEYAQAGRGNWYTREIGRLIWLGTAACALAFCAGMLVWNSVSEPIRWTILPILLVTLALEAPKSIALNRLNAERKQSRFAIWMSLESWLQIACWAIALSLWKTPEAYLGGLAAGAALALLAMGFVFAPQYPPDTAAPEPDARRKLVRKTLEFGLPFVPVSSLHWAATLADRFVVSAYKGTAEVGFYSVVSGIAGKPVTFASSALSFAMRPVLYAAASEHNAARVRRVFLGWLGVALLVGLGCFLFCWLGSEVITSILLAKGYRDGSPALLFWAALSFALVPATQAIENRLMASGMTRALILPHAVNAVCALATAFIFVPRFGAVGAAQARAVGATVQFAVTALALFFLPPVQPSPAPAAMAVSPEPAGEGA